MSDEDNDDPLRQSVARYIRRKSRARGVGGSIWAQVARVGIVGWIVALPLVGGALAGHALDQKLGTGIRWSLAFLMVGLVISGYSLWRLLADETLDVEEHERGEDAND